MSEVSIGILKRQCLNWRIYDAVTLRAEVAAWQHHHNTVDRLIDRQFTTDDTRFKLVSSMHSSRETIETTLEATLSRNVSHGSAFRSFPAFR